MSESTADRRRVAAFDFDGTISRRDTLGPFLAHVAGTKALVRTLLSRTPQFAAVTLGILADGVDLKRLDDKTYR